MGHPFTGVPAANYQVADSFRNIIFHEYFADDMLTCNTAKRSFFRRLPDAHISANPCKHTVPAPYCHRKIKGGNDPNNSKRMILFVHTVGGSFTLHGQSV